MLGFATGLNKRKKRKLYSASVDNQITQNGDHEENNASPLSKRKKDDNDEQPERKLSSKQKKRLKNFVERKTKESERVKLINSLAENALNDQQLKLMHSSKTLGQRESTKHKLRRMLQEERSGISGNKPSNTVSLLVSNVHMNEDEEDEEDEEAEEVEKPKIPTPPPKTTVVATNNTQPTKAKQSVTETIAPIKVKDTTYSSSASSKSVYVVVERPENIQEQRLKLPIVMEEQKIMETINENLITILCGETGSGKTTQLPQFLYEAGFGSPSSEYNGIIGVTEPRRVAAISMSKRVSTELNLEFGKEVGYQIRYDASISSNTKIKFATDGILLKEIQNDFLLSKYSAIIIDEAHERSLNTDILLGLLSKIVLARKEYKDKNKDKKLSDLKLIIMSATLRVEDFVSNRKLFSVPPPVISIDSRQFPVSIHFSKHTPENYMEEAYRKVCKIHKKLPPGGILVFVTGQQEIEGLCRKLRKKFPVKRKTVSLMPKKEEEKEKVQVKEYKEGEEHKILDEDEEEEKEKEDPEIEEAPDYTTEPLYVLPLYSMLNSAAQLKVFETPPSGTRLVVVATNVAETSLTIPGIKYVVDTGKVKELYYDKTTGITEFKITWTSQASANQRSGRAGRTSAGHCYRLYSSAVYANTFKQFSSPEIELMPIEGVILQMKSMGIDNIENFPFPSSPDLHSLKAATKILTYLGALDSTTQKITELGNTLAAFPVSPRYAKMLILGKQGGCLPYIIAIVATLTVRDPILRELDEESLETDTQEQPEKRNRKAELRKSHGLWKHEQSDLLAILRAIGAFEYSGASEKFCEEKHLHFKSMKEIRLLRMQLTNIINSIDSEDKLEFNAKLLPPSKDQELVIRQIICSGLLDQVAKYQIESGQAYYSILGSNDKVYIHPSSYLSESNPEYCVYREISYTSRPFMKGITAIQSSWLPKLAIPLCHFSKPLELPAPRYDSSTDSIKCTVRVSFGPHSWELPNQEIDLQDNDKFKYFAKALLEGQLFPKMKTIEPYLIAKPNLILKSIQSNKVAVLVETLTKHQIFTKQQLQSKWKEQPRFLISALSLWIDKSNQNILDSIWPPL